MLTSCGFAQTSGGEQAFEVASIRAAPAFTSGNGITPGFHGGPGTRDPGLYTCNNCTLVMLIAQAYGIELYSRITMPGAMPGAFNLSAKVPENATKEQFQVMLQNLLADRFKLVAHREKKEMPAYELIVAKGGPKISESLEESPSEPARGDAPTALPSAPTGRGTAGLDSDGFVIRPGCNGCLVLGPGGRARVRYSKTTMDDFCRRMPAVVGGKTVVDATGLRGKYDFMVTWDFVAKGMGRGVPSPPSGAVVPSSEGSERLGSTEPDSGQTFAGAVQSQLGLKLVEKKALVDLLVVDHVEKVPTEN